MHSSEILGNLRSDRLGNDDAARGSSLQALQWPHCGVVVNDKLFRASMQLWTPRSSADAYLRERGNSLGDTVWRVPEEACGPRERMGDTPESETAPECCFGITAATGIT